MRHLSALLVLALVAACAGGVTPGTFLEGSFDVPEALVSPAVPAETMDYLIRFPEGWVEGEEVPLVVFLHGSGDDDYDTQWLTSYGLPAAVLFDAVPTDHRFVLLAPRATPGTAWWWGRQAETVMALVDDVVDAHGLDGSDLVLTGLSMGGYGAWHLATRFPERFDRVASVSGSGYGSTELPADLDVCRLATTDVRAYHGAEDRISLLDLNLAVISEWEDRCSGAVETRVLEGVGHFGALEVVYSDAAFYEWFVGPAITD